MENMCIESVQILKNNLPSLLGILLNKWFCVP